MPSSKTTREDGSIIQMVRRPRRSKPSERILPRNFEMDIGVWIHISGHVHYMTDRVSYDPTVTSSGIIATPKAVMIILRKKRLSHNRFIGNFKGRAHHLDTSLYSSGQNPGRAGIGR